MSEENNMTGTKEFFEEFKKTVDKIGDDIRNLSKYSGNSYYKKALDNDLERAKQEARIPQ